MQAFRYIKHLDTLLFAVAAYWLIQCFTAYSGIGISPDSVMYASTAHSIRHEGTLTTFNGGPLLFFPAFYPAFLSGCILLFNADPVGAGPAINGVLFAALILLCGWLIGRMRPGAIIYKWAILIVIVLSPALLEMYTYLWSETLFILLTILFAAAFGWYLKKQTLSTLLVAAAIAAMACVTRYIGITVVATGCLLIFIDGRGPLKKRLINLLVFGGAGISLLIINLVINRVSGGLATGTREPAVTSFSENFYYFGTVLADWTGLNTQAQVYGWVMATAILIGLIISLLLRVAKRKYNYEKVLLAFAVVYSLFILILATISRFEQLNSRLLSPLFIPLLISCTAWVPVVVKRIRRLGGRRSSITTIAIVLAVCYIYNYILIDLKRYDDEFDYGVPGYTDDDWNKSPFVIFLKSHKNIYQPGVPIYSNADDAVYFFDGMRSTLMPHRSVQKDVAKLKAQKHFYIIWFDAFNYDNLIGLDDFKQLKLLHKLDDGAVYEFKK